ncbi:hypothetical protein [Psychroserpens sp.]|uniref:hypothetical protein n=1 Tax=Psychroserpens sp. TaxID=2020870 RepID=UPI002B2649D7|nr:hypothetical protein [Psychroserpens sp.]
MQRYGFILDLLDDGFGFYTNKQTNLVELLTYIKKGTDEHYFDFHVNLTDSNFFNYTDLPLDWSGTLFYDSQSQKNLTETNNITLKPELSVINNLGFFANIKIHFDTVINLYNSKKVAPVFNLNFKSRASIWEYYIIDRTSITGEDITIVGAPDIQFIKHKNVRLFNGETAVKLTSNRGIAFSQYPMYKFNLVNLDRRPNGNGINVRSEINTIVEGLPNPSLSQIDIIDFKGKKTVSSPIYIYV